MDYDHLLIPIFVLSCLILEGSNASLSPEMYWKSILPDTPMPKALQELLPSDAGISNTFPELSDFDGGGGGARDTYGTGYWSETKKFDKNAIFNMTTIYFLYNDLHPHKKMTLIFTKSTNKGFNFLPRQITESIPFSSDKFAETLNYFSIKPISKEAKIMKQTIEECEATGIKGEDKHCATSLESLVDFVVGKLGNKVKTLCNDAEEENKKQEYTILEGIKMMGENHIVCHKEKYPYAIYYCHTISETKVYMVPMVGADGSKAIAVVVCHSNTSAWNPQHFAFQVLKVKPGESHVCHFLNSDTIVWVPN